MPTTYKNYSLSHEKGGDYGRSDAVLVIKKNGKTIKKIIRDTTNGLSHRCYGFYKNYIVSGGANGHLKIYNLKGQEIANLVGHTGEVWSIAIDGDRLVSGSDDQTIKIWDLRGVRDGRRETSIYPQLNIFVSKDNEWIVWTPEGFFNSSKNGAKFIGYHINQGSNKEAKFVAVDKLYNTFYRPDLIAKALRGEDISSYARGVNINKILSSGLAPEVKLIVDKKESKARDIELYMKVCDVGGGYDNLTLLINNTPVKVITSDRAIKLRRKKVSRNCFAFNQTISLVNGINEIGFKATDKTGRIKSNLDKVVVKYNSKTSTKPNLYLLTISINGYKDENLRLKFPNSDALALSDKIKNVAKSKFNNIYSYSLKDDEVVKDKLIKEFEKIGKRVKPDDVFVLFMAGHGVMNDRDSNYYFIPYNFYQNDDITTKAISQKDLMLAMSQIPATKSIILLDTCQSGSFTKELENSTMSRLTTQVGRAIISASSKNQVALEGYKNHGVFTYFLLNSLDDNKVYGYDNRLSISEIANYLKYILPKETMKKWGYIQEPKAFLQGSDFVISEKDSE